MVQVYPKSYASHQKGKAWAKALEKAKTPYEKAYERDKYGPVSESVTYKTKGGGTQTGRVETLGGGQQVVISVGQPGTLKAPEIKVSRSRTRVTEQKEPVLGRPEEESLYVPGLKVTRTEIKTEEPLVTTFRPDSVFTPEIKESYKPSTKTPYEILAQEDFGPVSVLPPASRPKVPTVPEKVIAEVIQKSREAEKETPKRTIQEIVGVVKPEVTEVKTKISPTDVTNTARRISLLNSRIDKYNKGGMFEKDKKEKERLENEREKLAVELKKKNPGLDIEGMLLQTDTSYVDSKTDADEIEKKIYLANPERSLEVLKPKIKEIEVRGQELKELEKFYAPLYDKNTGKKRNVSKDNKFLALETWREEKQKEVDKRRENLNLYSQSEVNAYNEFITKLNAEDDAKEKALKKEVTDYNKKVEEYVGDVGEYTELLTAVQEPLIERQRIAEKAAEELERKEKEFEEKFFVDKEYYPPSIPGTTVMPETITEKKEEWYTPISKFLGTQKITVPGVGLLAPTVSKILPNVIEEKIEPYIKKEGHELIVGTEVPFIKGVVEREKARGKFIDTVYPLKIDYPKIVSEMPKVTTIEKELKTDTTELEKIKGALKGGYKIEHYADAKYIEEAIQNSNIPLRTLTEKDTSFSYYSDVPTRPFEQRDYEKKLVDELQSKLNDYYDKQVGKKAVRTAGSLILFGGIGEVAGRIATGSETGKKIVEALNIPFKTLFYTGQGLKGYQAYKEKDPYKMYDVVSDVLALEAARQWAQATEGKPITKTFIEPAKSKIAQIARGHGTVSKFYRALTGMAPPPEMRTPKVWTPYDLELQQTVQRDLYGGPTTTARGQREVIRDKLSWLSTKETALKSLRAQATTKQDLAFIDKNLANVNAEIMATNTEFKNIIKAEPGTLFIKGVEQPVGYVPEPGEVGAVYWDSRTGWKIPGDPGYIGPVKVAPDIQTKLITNKIVAMNLKEPGVYRPFKVEGGNAFVQDVKGRWIEADPKTWKAIIRPSGTYFDVEKPLTANQIRDLGRQFTSVDTGKQTELTRWMPAQEVSPEMNEFSKKLLANIESAKMDSLLFDVTKMPSPVKPSVKTTGTGGQAVIQEGTQITDTDILKGFVRTQPTYTTTLPGIGAGSFTGGITFGRPSPFLTTPWVTEIPPMLSERTDILPEYELTLPKYDVLSDVKLDTALQSVQTTVPSYSFMQEQFVGVTPVVTPKVTTKTSGETVAPLDFDYTFADFVPYGGVPWSKITPFVIPPFTLPGSLPSGRGTTKGARGVAEWDITNAIRDIGGEWLTKQKTKKYFKTPVSQPKGNMFKMPEAFKNMGEKRPTLKMPVMRKAPVYRYPAKKETTTPSKGMSASNIIKAFGTIKGLGKGFGV